MKKILILTGGGDCPGLNAVIRAVAKRARKEKGWEVYGSIEAFHGVFNEPQEIIKLTSKRTAGIHVKGGTILKTTNKGNPIKFPIQQTDGSFKFVDRSDELVKKLQELEKREKLTTDTQTKLKSVSGQTGSLWLGGWKNMKNVREPGNANCKFVQVYAKSFGPGIICRAVFAESVERRPRALS